MDTFWIVKAHSFGLEHWNFTSLLVLYVFIQPEQEHECKEEPRASQEVPDVVPE